MGKSEDRRIARFLRLERVRCHGLPRGNRLQVFAPDFADEAGERQIGTKYCGRVGAADGIALLADDNGQPLSMMRFPRVE